MTVCIFTVTSFTHRRPPRDVFLCCNFLMLGLGGFFYLTSLDFNGCLSPLFQSGSVIYRMQLQVCFYISILFIYIQARTHTHTLSRLWQCGLSPVPDELQPSFDVVSVWQAVSSLALGKYLLMLEDYLLISELCWWMVSALVANLRFYRSLCWFFPYGGCQQDPLLEEGGNGGVLLDWQNGRNFLEHFRVYFSWNIPDWQERSKDLDSCLVEFCVPDMY